MRSLNSWDTHNHHDGKYPDTIIKHFRALLDNWHDATHHVTIYSDTREVPKQRCCNKMYTSDEQLQVMELCIYHGIKVQVQGLEGERTSQNY
jgi:hypothetical protein